MNVVTQSWIIVTLAIGCEKITNSRQHSEPIEFKELSRQFRQWSRGKEGNAHFMTTEHLRFVSAASGFHFRQDSVSSYTIITATVTLISRHELHAIVAWCPLLLEMSRDQSDVQPLRMTTGRLLCHRWPRASSLIICLHTFPSAIPQSQRLSMPACSMNCTGIFAIVSPGYLLGV